MYRVPTNVDTRGTDNYFLSIWPKAEAKTEQCSFGGPRCVFLCYTNRSGSNLLGRLLRASGVFPKDSFDEFFGPQVMTEAKHSNAATNLEQYCRLLIRTDYPLNGIKINAHQLLFIARSGLLGTSRDRPRFLFIKRQDLLDQAISYEKAKCTQEWWLPRNTKQTQLTHEHYDEQKIIASIQEIAENNMLFESFFAMNGVDPMVVTYEDLGADPLEEVSRVFRKLNFSLSEEQFLAMKESSTAIVKQADETNARWRTRFLENVRGL